MEKKETNESTYKFLGFAQKIANTLEDSFKLFNIELKEKTSPKNFVDYLEKVMNKLVNDFNTFINWYFTPRIEPSDYSKLEKELNNSLLDLFKSCLNQSWIECSDREKKINILGVNGDIDDHGTKDGKEIAKIIETESKPKTEENHNVFPDSSINSETHHENQFSYNNPIYDGEYNIHSGTNEAGENQNFIESSENHIQTGGAVDLFQTMPIDIDLEDEDESDEVFSEETEQSRIFDDSKIEELPNLFVEPSNGNLLKSLIHQHNFSRSKIQKKSGKKGLKRKNKIVETTYDSRKRYKNNSKHYLFRVKTENISADYVSEDLFIISGKYTTELSFCSKPQDFSFSETPFSFIEKFNLEDEFLNKLWTLEGKEVIEMKETQDYIFKKKNDKDTHLNNRREEYREDLKFKGVDFIKVLKYLKIENEKSSYLDLLIYDRKEGNVLRFSVSGNIEEVRNYWSKRKDRKNKSTKIQLKLKYLNKSGQVLYMRNKDGASDSNDRDEKYPDYDGNLIVIFKTLFGIKIDKEEVIEFYSLEDKIIHNQRDNTILKSFRKPIFHITNDEKAKIVNFQQFQISLNESSHVQYLSIAFENGSSKIFKIFENGEDSSYKIHTKIDLRDLLIDTVGENKYDIDKFLLGKNRVNGWEYDEKLNLDIETTTENNKYLDKVIPDIIEDKIVTGYSVLGINQYISQIEEQNKEILFDFLGFRFDENDIEDIDDKYKSWYNQEESRRNRKKNYIYKNIKMQDFIGEIKNNFKEVIGSMAVSKNGEFMVITTKNKSNNNQIRMFLVKLNLHNTKESAKISQSFFYSKKKPNEIKLRNSWKLNRSIGLYNNPIICSHICSFKDPKSEKFTLVVNFLNKAQSYDRKMKNHMNLSGLKIEYDNKKKKRFEVIESISKVEYHQRNCSTGFIVVEGEDSNRIVVNSIGGMGIENSLMINFKDSGK